MAMGHDVNYKVHMHVRRMMSENKMAKKKKKANGSAGKNMTVSFENEKQRNGHHSGAPLRVAGSAKHLQDEVIHEAVAANNSQSNSEDEDGGLSFAPPGVNAARMAARRDMQNQQTTLSGRGTLSLCPFLSELQIRLAFGIVILSSVSIVLRHFIYFCFQSVLSPVLFLID